MNMNLSLLLTVVALGTEPPPLNFPEDMIRTADAIYELIDLNVSTQTVLEAQIALFREQNFVTTFVSAPWFSEGSRVVQLATFNSEPHLVFTDVDSLDVRVEKLPPERIDAELQGWTSEGDLVWLLNDRIIIEDHVIELAKAPVSSRPSFGHSLHLGERIRATIKIHPQQDCYAFSSGEFDAHELAISPEGKNHIFFGRGWHDSPHDIGLPDYYWRADVTAVSPSCALAIHAYDGRLGRWVNLVWKHDSFTVVPLIANSSVGEPPRDPTPLTSYRRIIVHFFTFCKI